MGAKFICEGGHQNGVVWGGSDKRCNPCRVSEVMYNCKNLFQLLKYPLLIRRIQNSAIVSLWSGLQCQGPPVTCSQPKTGRQSLRPWWPIPQAPWQAWRLQPYTKLPSDPSALLGEARHHLQHRQRQVAFLCWEFAYDLNQFQRCCKCTM
jgi:hypothetical protein